MRTDSIWLDIKLGARMLVKYPGLALVGGLGMAVAIAIGACFSVTMYSYFRPTLPLDEGGRIVGIQNWDAAANEQEHRALHDFVTWREELESVDDLGAFRDIERNLIAPGGPVEPVDVAEITATGFRVARVPPLLGRPIVEADEREGAPPVVVIGYDVWRARFASDPAIVGRIVRLGNTAHTVVGVMPEGFEFPVNHGFWTPLHTDPSKYERRQGPAITIFGRLAPGATLGDAQTELTMIGRRTAAAFPETHGQIRPRVLPYTALFIDGWTLAELRFLQILVSTLLVVICVNVATLVYARTATRQGEIVVRNALGASRRRIVAQLFAEALVLSAAAAAAGLGIAWLALRLVGDFVAQLGGIPFWVDLRLSSGTVGYVLGLAALGAVIVGVVPAVQATGHRVASGLRQLGGGTGMQLGRTWTLLIVAQVAFAVAALPMAVFYAQQFISYGTAEPGFAAEEFLTASLVLDRETPPSREADAYQREFTSRFTAVQSELARRLKAEPGVADVTFSLSLPSQEPTVWIEVDGLQTPAQVTPGKGVRSGTAGHEARFNRVDLDFFDTYDVPVLTGRRFQSGDLGTAATAVIVNRAFVQQILGGGNALGRRVRYVGRGADVAPDNVELGRWYEIVGVVADLPANPMEPGLARGKMYHPLAPGQAHPVSLSLRVKGGDPAIFTGRLREVASALDPTLRSRNPLPLDRVLRQNQGPMRLTALALAIATGSVLLLSAAGIYALMSFTVTRRRREIGIRTALGAHPRQIVAAIFSRALRQLVIGVVVGVLAAVQLEKLTEGALVAGKVAVLLPAVATLMMAVGILAMIGPARRVLLIQPTEAFREG